MRSKPKFLFSYTPQTLRFSGWFGVYISLQQLTHPLLKICAQAHSAPDTARACLCIRQLPDWRRSSPRGCRASSGTSKTLCCTERCLTTATMGRGRGSAGSERTSAGLVLWCLVCKKQNLAQAEFVRNLAQAELNKHE